MSAEDRFDARELPADLLRSALRGELSAYDARGRARERWLEDERRGGSMNDMIRAGLAERSTSGRMVRYQAGRDARGRFAAEQEAHGAGKASPTMNDLMRESMYGAGAYPARAPRDSSGGQASTNDLLREQLRAQREMDRGSNSPNSSEEE